MNLLMSILPIAFIIAIIIIMVRVHVWARFVTSKITHWLLIIYTGVLLLSMIFVLIVTEDIGENPKKVRENTEQVKEDIYDLLSKGKVDQVDRKYLVKKSSFEYKEKMLTVTPNNDQGVVIFIERKPINDNKIELSIFGGSILINGYDYSNLLKPINYSINGQNLYLTYPEYQNIDLTMVKSEFPINQFTGRSMMDNGIADRSPLVYLRIPKDIKLLNDNSLHFRYVKE